MLPKRNVQDLQDIIVEPHGVLLNREVPSYEKHRATPGLTTPLFYWYQGANAKIDISFEGEALSSIKMTTPSK